ncbi:hypothetical protein [Streptomyces sp. NBC_00525]|uniref:hypothetical protein n=1 Tax=Streptomyces sp. NBC_00525 TaxID=2903660 RepID=UPI002E805DC9|nr:hypothetical protein [Streptomyces sp. NBC_00525]WUC97878.1 hypothetical protein OG710_29810 [Streptomyces sp. NBC_00525]
MRQQLLGAAAALPTALTGAPWWAIAACVVLGALVGQLRGLLRDRASRKLDAFFMATISELADAQEKARVLIDYRRAGAPEPAEPGTGDGRPEDSASS